MLNDDVKAKGKGKIQKGIAGSIRSSNRKSSIVNRKSHVFLENPKSKIENHLVSLPRHPLHRSRAAYTAGAGEAVYVDPCPGDGAGRPGSRAEAPADGADADRSSYNDR
jgi:hypothetical protein